MNNFFKSLIHKRNDYNPKSKLIINKYGMYKIKSISLGRKPLNTVLNFFAKSFSINRHYDKYYHLFMIVILENNVSICIEKNQVIKISNKIPSTDNDTEYLELDIIHHPTLFHLLKNSQDKRNEFFMYKADSNNCQKFINDLLIDSNLWNVKSQVFIMQDVSDIFKNNVQLRKFINTTTDIAARIDVLQN
jgi:hypothetical protein